MCTHTFDDSGNDATLMQVRYDYSYHIEVEAKRRFLQLLKDRFNSGIKYRGKTWNWDGMIQVKTRELARFLLGRSDGINFAEPTPTLVRTDSRKIRRRILELSADEARRLGIGKTTLHYLHKNTGSDRSFKVYRKVRETRTRIRCLGIGQNPIFLPS